MSDLIIENQKEIRYPQIGTTYYAKDVNLKIHHYYGSLRITDITDALRTGKVCPQISISMRCARSEETPFISELLHKFDYDFKKIYDYYMSLEWIDAGYGGYKGIEQENMVTIYKSEDKAIRIFSPFNLKYMKPLKETPKKWTVRHVLRLIVNGQYENLECDGRYTDDYAYDAAYNYGMGAIENGLAFAKSIIQCPSGWWVSDYKDRGKLSISCHTFDCNSLTPVIK